ncbi:MAG: site-2 protease family protein [Oscillospiraceae bacterium]|nr:site-2 protease family protein [Oscillospiraceae bacterium]
MTAVYILIAILLFGVLIVVHEAGHFTAAKLCGVRVNEFAVGMGPAVIKRKKGETEYSLRCIPIGGYCAMAGEDEESDDPRAFTNQPAWKRLIILIAGSLMNFLLGMLIIAILFAPAGAFISPVIASFAENCPYDGPLQVGDRFYSVDGHRIYQYYDFTDYMEKGGPVHDIVVIRDGQRFRLNDFSMEKLLYEGETQKRYGFSFGYEEATFAVKLRNVWNTSMEFVRWVWAGLAELVSGNVSVDDISGPVGIVDMIAETGEQAESTSDAFYSIFYLGAFIAINLAVMNMLPIPALDGGRVFLLIVTAVIEKIIGKKLDPRYEGYIHAAGMVLLLAFMAFIMFNDVLKLFRK